MEIDARTYAGERRRCHPYGRNLHAHVRGVHGRGGPAFVLEVPQFRLVQRGEDLEGRRRARTLRACDTCALYPELQPVPVFPVLGLLSTSSSPIFIGRRADESILSVPICAFLNYF